MALPPQQQIDTILGTIIKASTFAIGFSTFLGSLIFVLYCLHLDYFPSGVTAGDSLIFIVLAACFGVLYGLVVTCLLSVGVCITYCFNPLLKPLGFLCRKLPFSRPANASLEPFRFVKPSIIHLMLFVFGIGLVLKFANQNWQLLFQLSSTILMISLAWTLHQNNELKRDALSNEPETRANGLKLKKLNQLKYLLLGFIFVVPIVFGGIALNTLEGGMRLSNLQKRASYVLIQPPYSHFIPTGYKVTDPRYIEPGYTTFKDINVMLTGIGQKTIIQFSLGKGKPLQPFEIPNDKIIVIPATK